MLQKSFNAAQASKESHYRSTRIHGTKRTKPTRCIPRTQSKGHGGDEQACGSPIEQGWQHPLQTHHTPQMHADACYPHRRGSRSPSEVHEHTEDGPTCQYAGMVSAAATSQSVSPMDPIEKKGSI